MLLALGAIAALAVVAVVLFLRSETGRRIVRIAKAGREIAHDAATAPGVAELRGLGCLEAGVVDLETVASQLGGPGTRRSAPPTVAPLVVVCRVRSPEESVPCDEVAGTYVEANGGEAPRAFDVLVVHGQRSPLCRASYLVDGTREPVEPVGP